jgi:hypothetical protein
MFDGAHGIYLIHALRRVVVGKYDLSEPHSLLDCIAFKSTNTLSLILLGAHESRNEQQHLIFQGIQLDFAYPFSTPPRDREGDSIPHMLVVKQIVQLWKSYGNPLYCEITSPRDIWVASNMPLELPTLPDVSIPNPSPFYDSAHMNDTKLNTCSNQISTQFQFPEYSFIWMQTSTDVSIHLSLSGDLRADINQVQWRVNGDQIHLSISQVRTPSGTLIHNALTLLEGNLWTSIVTSESLWTIESRRHFTIHLEKQSPGTRWSQLFQDETLAPLETQDPSELIAFREQIEKYTSEINETMGVQSTPSMRGLYNDGREDIDVEIDEHHFHLVHIDSAQSEGAIHSKVDSGLHQYLGMAWPFGVCLKYDVDGLVYQASESSRLVHTFTQNALAYIQASKRDRRFTIASSNFALVIESRKTCYVYMSRVNHLVSVQHVLDLGTDEVVGCQLLPYRGSMRESRAFIILTTGCLHFVNLSPSSGELAISSSPPAVAVPSWFPKGDY